MDGELDEIKNLQKKNKRMEIGKARTIKDLETIAEKNGYKRGWIYKQMQIKGIFS